MDEAVDVDLYWRPGCPYCVMLRFGLRRARLPLREINIWSDPAAAAFVRSAAGGNETVPTVAVAGRAMVNPSTREVLAAVARTAPSLAPAQPDRFRARAGYALLAAVAWLLLVWLRPETTFHLAPAIATAAWAVAERLASLAPLTRVRATVAVAGGAAVTHAAAAWLYVSGGLAGPALFGGSALGETLIVAAAAAVVTWWGVTRGERREPCHGPPRAEQS